jgi:hypothetical protein
VALARLSRLGASVAFRFPIIQRPQDPVFQVLSVALLPEVSPARNSTPTSAFDLDLVPGFQVSATPDFPQRGIHQTTRYTLLRGEVISPKQKAPTTSSDSYNSRNFYLSVNAGPVVSAQVQVLQGMGTFWF